MLINLSNHPFNKWSTTQQDTAIKQYSRVVDLPFPTIDPNAEQGEVYDLAAKYASKCMEMITEDERHSSYAIHVMGESCFCFAIISILKKSNVTCIASTTERIVRTNADSSKTSEFAFVKFREY